MSWLVFIAIAVVVALVVALTFKSFRRWHQPLPGRTPEADRAEAYLDWQMRSHGDQST